MKRLLALAVVALLPLQAWAADPPVVIELGARHGHATPQRQGCTHTAAGNIIIAQPTADVVTITMTGVAVATAHPFKSSNATMTFDLNQELKVVINDPKVKKAKLVVRGVVVGLLRSECGLCGQTTGHRHGCGCANQAQGCVAVGSNGTSLVSLCVDPHGVSGGESLSVNCSAAPCEAPVLAGCYTLHQTFAVSASAPQGICGRPASAEFAPDAVDPLWLGAWEPFRGAAKKDFGFTVTLQVVAD
jgi:hypothetical protein